MPKIYKNGKQYAGVVGNADNIKYNNTTSGLKSERVRGAIDELQEEFIQLNSNLGSIASHNIARVSGSTPSSKGQSVIIAYPDGFSIDNCTLMSYKVRTSSDDFVVNGYSDRIQIILKSNGIYVYINHDSMVNKHISIWLYS